MENKTNWFQSRDLTLSVCYISRLSLQQQQKNNRSESGTCGFRPFDFHSIWKIENQNFTIVIFNV